MLSPDIDIDARMVDETSQVDWHQVTEAEGSSFGLALGLYRDALHSYEKRRIAWGTAVGSVVSLSVLFIVASFAGLDKTWTAAIILGSQFLRSALLFRNTQNSFRVLREQERGALEAARELASRHPLPQ
jgi:hypothetical protein